jgi:hypothetical protein
LLARVFTLCVQQRRTICRKALAQLRKLHRGGQSRHILLGERLVHAAELVEQQARAAGDHDRGRGNRRKGQEQAAAKTEACLPGRLIAGLFRTAQAAELEWQSHISPATSVIVSARAEYRDTRLIKFGKFERFGRSEGTSVVRTAPPSVRFLAKPARVARRRKR